MDLDLYRQLLSRFWGVLVAIILVTTLGAVVFTASRPASYEGSVFISVAQSGQEQVAAADVYKFGEYYSLQGSNFLADYFRGWLKDPATVEEILRRSGGGLPDVSLQSISRFFNAKSLGTVGLQIFHTTSSAQETERILAETQNVLGERLASLQNEGYYRDFALVPGSVLVREAKSNLLVSGAIGFAAGLFLSVFALLLLAVAVPERRS